MDQNASNGPSKGSWRDKLGLGNGKKDMPKIADEFKPTPAEPKPVQKAPVTAPRAPQPVTKLAPMAPRTPGARSMPQLKPAPVPAPAKPTVAAAGQDSLAERLKAQRQAAEKLAEQRVSMAREKAEARAADSVAARKEEPRPTPAPADKPKFTFADEEIAAAKRETPSSPGKEFQAGLLRKTPPPPPPPINGPSVTPPRPTLGGEKPIAGTTGDARRMQPQLGGSTQPSLGYRPLDPPSFQSALKRGSGIQTPQRTFTPPRPSFGDNGFGDQRRREPAEDFRRRPEPTLRGDDRDTLRAEARRGPGRGRRQDFDEDMGDVFEDEAPPQRRRANARDYNQAYQEYDENDRDEAPRRRSSGPLLILLAILVVAGLFVTGLWYYYFHMKPVSVTSGGSVPVITAPTDPAKVNPEPNTETTGSDLAPAATAKKKIYDRILGEADTGGQMVPTEEAPAPVEQMPTPQPDNTNMLPEPVAPSGQTGLSNDSSAMPIPEPAGGGQSAGETMPEPLPLPPTPGNDGTQGSLQVPDTQALAAEVDDATRGAQASSLSAVPEPPAPEPSTTAGQSLAMAEANDGAAIDEQATPPSDDEPAAAAPAPDEEAQPPKAKAKQKTATTKPKKQKAAAEEAAASGEPLVLVAPEELPPPPPTAESIAPSTQDVAATTNATSNSGSFFGTGAKKLTGKRAENAGSATKAIASSQQASVSTQDQVASIDTQQSTTSSALEPEPAPKPTTSSSNSSSSGGTGYVAQVASLRSEAEARAELDRLRGSYGSLIGNLSTRITKATVAGTTRYRLGFGPLPSRSQAAKLCSSLIAAGERDCAVRGL